MDIKGISVGFTDCDPEFAEEFNRWYDFDHVPENIALTELLTARRYVATTELKAARGTVEVPELADGAGSYLATYWAGTDDLQKMADTMGGLFRELLPKKRIFRQARIVFSGRYRLVGSYISQDIPQVATGAIPYLPHRGMQVVISDVPDAALRGDVARWYTEVHIPDLLSVPAIVAALRFEDVDPEHEGRTLHLFLTQEDPGAAVREIQEHRPRWVEQGRTPYPDGASRTLFAGPYRLITPLQYDFQT